MKKKIMAIVLILVLSLQISGVAAYGSQHNGSLDGVNITVSNTINADKKKASAQTWTNSPAPSTSVNATFYWLDFERNVTGTEYRNGGGYGSSSISVTISDESLRYYKVISNHSVSYNGGRYSYPNMTTVVP